MKNTYTLIQRFVTPLILFLLCSQVVMAQITVTKSYTPAVAEGPFTNTFGTPLPGVTFAPGTDFPVGHVVTKMEVEIIWSKTDGGVGAVVDLTEVGFMVVNPLGTQRMLATSTNYIGFPLYGASTTSATWAGNIPVNRDTVTFKDGSPLITPPAQPNLANAYFSPNAGTMATTIGTDFLNTDPNGTWRIDVIDDGSASAAPLFVHSYSITITACAPASLTAVCQANPSVSIDSSGLLTLDFADLDAGSDTSCGIQSLTISPNGFNCSDIGSSPNITMSITDCLGNSASCNSTVNIVDAIAPVFVCPPSSARDTVYLDNSCTFVYNAAAQMTVSDNCNIGFQGVQISGLPPATASITFDQSNLGLIPIVFEARDLAGNTSTCGTVVAVLDTTSPIANCKDTTVYLTSAGTFSVDPSYVDDNSIDSCAMSSIRELNGGGTVLYNCSMLGVNPVVLKVYDSSLNEDTCVANVTVLDTISPVPHCFYQITAYVDALGNVTVPANAFDSASTDNCGIDTIRVNGGASVAFNCANIGTPQIVTLEYKDSSNNSVFCTSRVLVLDTFPPTAVCQNIFVYLNSSGVAIANAADVNNGSSDVCTGTTLNFTFNTGSATASYDCSALGAGQPVVLLVSDTYGNVDSCNTFLNVIDTLPPTAVCATGNVYLNALGNVRVRPSDVFGVTSSDNCGIIDTFINIIGNKIANFSCSAINTPQTVQLIVEDESFLHDTCTATVNVLDTIAPTAICNSSINADLNASTGLATINIGDVDNGSTDNCTLGVSLLLNGGNSITYDCDSVGTRTAVLVITDSSGNSSSCSTLVNVNDITPPAINCQNVNVTLNSGIAIVNPNSILIPPTGDACGIATQTINGGNSITYDCDSVGVRTVLVRITDNNGLAATCVRTVTVEDITDPTASCAPGIINIDLDANGVGFVVPSMINFGSSDDCNGTAGIDTMYVNGLDTLFFDCTDVGTRTVTLTVEDASGRTDDCTATLNIRDNIPPTAMCHDTTLYFTTASPTVVTALPSDIDAGSTDNCPGNINLTINGAPSFNYTCSNVGLGGNTATLFVNSGSSTAFCNAQITIIDTIKPVANCQPGPINVSLNSSGIAQLPTISVNNGSTDNCTNPPTFRTPTGASNYTFNCSHISTNPNPITLVVSDASGNTATCATTVNVVDNIKPTIQCKPDTVFLDGSCNAIATVFNINNSSYDNCSGLNLTIDNGANVIYTGADLGVNNVTLTGTDASGNIDSCITTITVIDNIPPIASCQTGPLVVQLDPSGNASLAATAVNSASSDNCGSFTFTTTTGAANYTFDCADVATSPNTITLLVTDGSNNTATCQSTVNVLDTVSPVANCNPSINVYLNPTGVSIDSSQINAGSVDNCGIATMVLSQSSFTCTNLGANAITLTVTDDNGNTATCPSTVNVLDTVSPTATCQPNGTVIVTLDDNTGTAMLAATAIDNLSDDNCAIDTLLINGLDSALFTCANIGNNIVTLRVEDASGQFSTCQTIIEVQDTTPPTVLCMADTLFLNSGLATLTVNDVDAGSLDNCNISTSSLSQTNFTCPDVGIQMVTLTITDVNNNAASCQAMVTIMDTVAPTANCTSPIDLFIDPSGSITLLPAMINNNSIDDCNIATYKVDGLDSIVYSCADIGAQIVNFKVTDDSGNADSCTATVNVSDTIKPLLNCATLTVDLDASGQAFIDSTQFGTFSDNCTIATIRIAGDSVLALDCTNIGTNNYTVVVTDVNGNIDSCQAAITVNDTTAPVVICRNNAIVYLDSTGSVTIPIIDLDNGSFDACGIADRYINPATFDCSNIGGGNTAWLVMVDSSGNMDSCQAMNITVADTVGPNMVCRDTTLFLPGSGTFINVLAGAIDAGTNDPCGFNPPLLINGVSNLILTCSDIGTQVAILEAQDIFGNIDTCHANLTLADTTSPVALCYDSVAVFLDPLGVVSTFGVQLDSASNDNCALDLGSYQINNLDSVIYNCGSIGSNPQVVTMTISDSSGNIGSCTSNVYVIDTLAPTAICRTAPLSVTLHPVNGTADVSAFSINNNSDDNCSVAQRLINGVTIYTYDCSEVDTNIAVLTIIDVNGNEDTCHAQVIVRDISSPSPNCQFNITTQLDSSGLVVFPVANVDNGSFDNCGIASYTVGGADTITFTCADILTSPNVISVTLTDSSGNFSTCNSAITVEDTIAPLAACPSLPVPVHLAGANVIINASLLDSASMDNCGPITYTINGSSTIQYTCSDVLALQNETLVMTDPAGNVTVCPVTVDVIDSVAPNALCKSVTVSLNAVGEVIVSPQQINNGSNDLCGLATPGLFINGLERDTFNCSNIGANLVTLSVVDISGNVSVCQDTVFVEDVTAPVLNCGVFNAFLNGNGQVIVSPQDVSSGNDACGITTWTINGQAKDTFSCADIGSIINVTISAADASGNTQTCNGFVNVIDTLSPVANCQPSTLTVNLDVSGVATVTASQLNFFSTDNCGLVDTLINGQPSVVYDCSDIGMQPAILRVIDAAGNSDTCTATIDVQDNIAPNDTCKNITVFLGASGISTVAATAIDAGSSDACGITTYLINSQSSQIYTCSDVGTKTATLTVIDPTGNTSVCVSTVTVVDSLAPNIVCKNVTAYLDNNGVVTVQAPAVVDTATKDNCGIANYRINGQPSIQYNCASGMTDTVTLTVTDVYGNADSCQAVVTILDTIAPTVVCSGTTVDLTNVGQVVLTPATLNTGGTNDICGIDTMFLSKDTITCDDKGIIPITVTAIDNNGNYGYCVAIVNVTLDRPSVTPDSITLCEGDTLFLNATIPSNGNNYNYEWKGPNGFITQDSTVKDTLNADLTGADEGLYIFWIRPKSGNGCPARDTTVLDVNVVEVPVIAGNDPLCEGGEAILNISNIATYTGDSLTFQWYYNNTPTGTGNDSLVFNPVSVSDTGDYTIFVYMDGCTDTMTVPYAMQVIPRPTAPAPTATIPCEGGTLTLDANPTDLSRTYTYVWTGPSAFSANTQNASVSNVTQANAGAYIVTLTDNYACTVAGSVNATINVTPQQPNLEYNQPLCFGDILELTENTSYPTGTSYIWETPTGAMSTTTINQLLLTNAAEGIYKVTVDLAGCLSEGDTAQVAYKVGPGALDDQFLGASGVPFRDSLMGINVTSNDAVSVFTIAVSDDPNGGTLVNYNNGTFDYKPVPSFFGIDTFSYRICDIQCPNTCDSANVVIEVTTDFECFIPEAISPNGDGINDFMNIRCINSYPDAVLRVFSRWGNLVYEGGLTGFNGQFDGKDLPDGTYFYFLKLNDTTNVPKDEFNGCIIIQR